MRPKPPKDLDELVRQLGYSQKRVKALQDKYGDMLMTVLKREWKRRQHTPRLLHRDSSRGYTGEPALAMRGAGEEIDEESQRRQTAEAHAREQDTATLAQVARQQRELSQQLAEMQAEAKRRGIDMSGDERVIKQRIRAMEKLFRRAE